MPALDADTEPSQRPVVVIPGILGSRLVSDDGDVLWGDRGSLGNFGRLDLDPAGTSPAVAVAGLVERIRVLGPFWTIHAYDELLVYLRALGFRDGQTLFTFPYDWRQSNYDTARLFASWVGSQPALQNTRFDIIAHSMGGIVARIWLLQLGGADRVRKAIYLGTPFQGSMNALGTLTDGWGNFANRIAGGIDLIRTTMLSFPAAYELFPRYARNCRLGNQSRHNFLNLYDPGQWNAHCWLPPAYGDGGARAAAFREYLERAERLTDLMAHPVPGIEEVRIAGDNQNTRLYLYVSRDDTSWRGWSFSFDRGDGTVPLWSAANAPDGNLAGTLPSFVEHATIFRDDWVKVVLQRELVITAPPSVNARQPKLITRSGGQQELDLLDAVLEPPIIAPGASTRLLVTLRFPANAAIGRGDISGLTAHLAGIDAPPVALKEITDDTGLTKRTLCFTAHLRAPDQEEIYRIDIDVPPLGRRAAYLTVERS